MKYDLIFRLVWLHEVEPWHSLYRGRVETLTSELSLPKRLSVIIITEFLYF